MWERYIERLKEICKIILIEIQAYLISIVGLIKSRILLSREKINKLEIGVGKSEKKEGFITSDLSLATDFPYDLRFGLPFKNESLDLIYSEHVLEHFSYRDLMFLLKDCYRVLKHNGVFSLVVFDPTIYLRAYWHPEEFEVEKYCSYDWGLDYHSNIDYVNYMFYMDGEHRYMFEEDSILKIISKIGFKDVRLRNFDPKLDREDRKYQSLYAQGVK